MRFGHSLVLAGSLCLALPSACSNEGQTPVCSTFPEPYDVRAERGRLNAREAMTAAAADGCLTLPAGFDDDAEGGAGGTDGGAASGAGGSVEPSGGVGAEAGAPADAGSAGASAEAGAAGASQ